MANFQYTSDLKADALFRAGEPTDGSSDWDARVLEYLNRAYRILRDGGSELDPMVREDWWWLRKSPPGVLTLQPTITTGSVTTTNNSTSITFSSAPAASVANYFFKIDSDSDVFRVATHTAASTAATLDSVYTGSTGAGKAFHLLKLEYDLASDVLRLIAPMRVYRPTPLGLRDYKIHGISLNELEEDYPLPLIEPGIPDLFAHVGETKVRFNRYGGLTSTELIRVEYDYLYKPADLANTALEEPVVPLDRRQILADIALVFLFADKDDSRATAMLTIAQRGLYAMAAENRHKHATQSDHTGKIRPRCPRIVRRGPLRTSSGLIIG